MDNLKKQLPPVTSLVAFEAAARLESFASAATELNVSREAVSRQIRMLEEYLGVLLFERDANRVTLGSIGLQFFNVVSPNLWAIANASTELGGELGESEAQPEQEIFLAEERSKLLVLDDIPENIHQLSGVLGGLYKIAAFSQAQEALQFLSGNRVDLAVLDIRMPGMSGLDVARRIRKTAAMEDLPIIFVTNLDTADDEVEALEAGGNDFISRPIIPAILKARIRTHIELARSRKSIETLLKRRVDRLERAEGLIRQLGLQIEQFQRD